MRGKSSETIQTFNLRYIFIAQPNVTLSPVETDSRKFTKESDKLGQREENNDLRRTWVFV